jgi:DNA repair exonuclease SbcCD ATPase subunit
VKKDRARIIASLEVQAKEQEKRNNERIAQDKKAKETADESANRQMAQLQRTIVRLRNDRERAPSVPAAPAGSTKPELACFDRAEFARTVGNLEAGMERIAGEGAEATVGLNAARDWAKTR